MENETRQPESKKMLIDIPIDLYERFQKSLFRRESNTDAEGIRAAIREAINSQSESQQ